MLRALNILWLYCGDRVVFNHVIQQCLLIAQIILVLCLLMLGLMPYVLSW